MAEAGQESKEYIVVFQYTTAAGGYAGVRTWTPFPSKAEFDAFYTPEVKEQEEAVDQGVTEAEAIAACRKTPLRSYVAAATEESTDPVTGVVDFDVLRSRLHQVALARGFR